jgi:hypothetical protein
LTDPRRIQARWTALILFASVAICLTLFELGVPYDPLTMWIVGFGAASTTLFVLLYGFTVRWQQTWIGRALMVSSAGTAGLLDVALANRVLPQDYRLQHDLILIVLVFMSTGGCLKLLALLLDKVPLWRGKRLRRGGEDSKSRP